MNNKPYHLYTEKEKLEIVNDQIDNKIPIRACASKYNIATSSLVYWLRSYRGKKQR